MASVKKVTLATVPKEFQDALEMFGGSTAENLVGGTTMLDKSMDKVEDTAGLEMMGCQLMTLGKHKNKLTLATIYETDKNYID